ncbi:MAG: hypothetical protein PHV02_17620 [Rhodocyclaceae bacterium]|nr:hypothetical protein [Rhodocyclaceae bacterium]
MSKLFKLKEWVTIPDAARHLSQIVNEPVSEADVLQMALDGHLKLTVDFPNRAKARIGRVIPYKDVPHHELPSLDGKGTFTYADGYPLHDIKNGEQLQGETPFIHFGKEVVSIDGLWDLAMLGNERIDIEFDLQNLIGGPEVTMTNIEGTFLNRSDGTWAALQDQFEDRTIADPDGKKKTIRGSYYPAGGLGTDCTRVIRTSEILALQSRLDGTALDKPLAGRERDTLLTIIAALCKDAGHDYTKHAKTAGLIQSTAAKMGVSIGETTIEGHLKKIPDALGTRMK